MQKGTYRKIASLVGANALASLALSRDFAVPCRIEGVLQGCRKCGKSLQSAPEVGKRLVTDRDPLSGAKSR
jgi:hypothetical protein